MLDLKRNEVWFVTGSQELYGKETLEKLDAIWPGPGGAAPEAYAW